MKYLSIDLEMTGTEPGWHEIIQIGAAMLDDDFNEIDTYLTNVYPENEESFSIPAELVHDLSIEELDEAPMLYDVIEEFEEWLMKVNRFTDRNQLKNIALCGQSVINDINFLRFAYKQEKLEWPFSYTIVDLHNISFFLFKVLEKNGIKVPPRRSLTAIAEFFGYKREGKHHNALEDAQLTALCLKHVFEYTDKLKI